MKPAYWMLAPHAVLVLLLFLCIILGWPIVRNCFHLTGSLITANEMSDAELDEQLSSLSQQIAELKRKHDDLLLTIPFHSTSDAIDTLHSSLRSVSLLSLSIEEKIPFNGYEAIQLKVRFSGTFNAIGECVRDIEEINAASIQSIVLRKSEYSVLTSLDLLVHVRATVMSDTVYDQWDE